MCTAATAVLLPSTTSPLAHGRPRGSRAQWPGTWCAAGVAAGCCCGTGRTRPRLALSVLVCWACRYPGHDCTSSSLRQGGHTRYFTNKIGAAIVHSVPPALKGGAAIVHSVPPALNGGAAIVHSVPPALNGGAADAKKTAWPGPEICLAAI